MEEAQLAANIKNVQEKIASAARQAGRAPEEITLIAVSKTMPLENVKQSYRLGLKNFGENRVQDALPKIAAFQPEDLNWHMIGHLQSNKASKVAGAFACIHSLDSLHLAEALNRYARERGHRQIVLLQINVSGEESKEGMALEETPELASQILQLPYLEVQGLMTIAPRVADPEEVRPVFRHLRLLRDQLREQLPQSIWQHLSMGMTDDYHVAIAEGATLVRIGRAIFGERTYK